jgi:hypothetical protein
MILSTVGMQACTVIVRLRSRVVETKNEVCHSQKTR